MLVSLAYCTVEQARFSVLFRVISVIHVHDMLIKAVSTVKRATSQQQQTVKYTTRIQVLHSRGLTPDTRIIYLVVIGIVLGIWNTI